jgi:predicted PurR-regulated permease PerM
MARGSQNPYGRGRQNSDFLRKTVTAVGVTLFGLVILVLAGLAINVLLVTFAGVLLAVFLLALRDVLVKHSPLKEGWALAVVITVLLALTVVGGALLAPQLAEQIDEFGQRLPAFSKQAEEFLQQYGWGRHVLDSVRTDEALEGVREGIGTFFSATVKGLALLVTFFAVALFVAINPGLYFDGMVRMMPLGMRPRAAEVLEEIGTMLRWFLVARAIAMLLVGLSTAVVLMLLGIPLALFLGVLAGLLTFIPYLGPIAAGVPIIMVALLEGVDMALYALVLYTAIQQIEGNIFDPLILQRVIRLPPVVTLVSQIMGGVFLGPLGVTLATPFITVMQVLVRRVYREDILGEIPEEEK